MRINNLIKFFVLPAIQFLTGFLSGILVLNLTYLSFDSTLSAGEVLSLLVAIFISFYVSYYLNSKSNNKKSEKDLIIKDFSGFITNLESLKEFIDDKYVSREKLDRKSLDFIIIRMKSLRKRLFLLTKELRSYSKNEKIGDTANLIETNLRTTWKSLTGDIVINKKISTATYDNSEADILLLIRNVSKLQKLVNNL